MPRYFVDLRDGSQLYRDDVGSIHDTLEQARKLATDTLLQVARLTLATDLDRDLALCIRDEGGAVFYRATLVFHGTTTGPFV